MAALIRLEEKQSEIVNVAKVNQLSPFRYPGGKTWLVPWFLKWIHSLGFKPTCLVEPFAGGGIISLSAAYYDLVDKCFMIEKDEDVASVWKTIFYGDWEWLVNRIISFELTLESANEILSSTAKNCEEMAFKTVIKNRIYHGGVLANGSGMLKFGEKGKGILSRWYPNTLAKRIKTIASMKDKIIFCEGNAFNFIPDFADNENVIYFVDPPYTASKKKAGKRLYRYYEIDHNELFLMLKNIKGKFLLTYDLDENVVSLAEKHNFNYQIIPMTGTHLSLRYELIILND